MKFSENLPKPLKEGIYEIDEFNNKPLFAVDNSNLKSKLVVSSWQEAYGLVRKFSSNDINPKYISQYLTNEFSTETSPYKKIERLPRCSTIKITKNGKIEIKKKEPFCSEYHQLSKKELSSFVKGKLINNLNNIFTDKKYIVGLEHSSGLDSNSILGCLLEGNQVRKENIHTFSRDGMNEIERIKKFRKFFGLELKNCHESYYDSQLNASMQILKSLGFPPIVSHDMLALNVFKKNNCSHILSGLGGDQCLSNSGKDIINDLIDDGSWYLAMEWLGGYANLAKFLLRKKFRNFSFLSRLMHTNLYKTHYFEKVITKVGRDYLYPYLEFRTRKKSNIYLKHHNSLKNCLLSEWLSLRCEQEKNLAKSYGMIKIFPLLDIDLLKIVLKQKPLLFAENHYSGRKVLKEAMSSLLPKDMNFEKNWFTDTAYITEKRKNIKNRQFEFLEENLNQKFELHSLTKKLFDIETLYKIGEKVMRNKNCKTIKVRNLNLTFEKISNLNMWFSYLDNDNLNS